MTRRSPQPHDVGVRGLLAHGCGIRGLLALIAASVVALGCASQALASNFTAGDVVVERDGNGGVEAITNASTPVYLNEFTPTGGLVTTLALPTEAYEGPVYENSKHEKVHEAEKPLLDQGSAISDGLLTLSENARCLLTVGYDAPLGVEKVDETRDTTTPRTVAVINKTGEINTTTALTDFANENNARSATSSECTKIWVGGAGSKTTGGVVAAEVKKEGTSTGTQLDENDTNVRQVEVVDGQLYASGDPEKAPKIPIGKMGSGLPTTKPQTITEVPFEALTAPEEPYAYSLLTLSPLGGSTPDTLYVADNKRSEVVKYGLSGGKWVERGAVEIPAELTGVTANDVGGAVTIYATSSGSSGKKGILYRISDVSGANGTLSGIPVEVATAPANEAFRGVAFAPGTTIGSGGTPPPAPTIAAAETALPAAIGDPTNPTMPITVGIVGSSGYTPGELTVSVTSSKESVAPATEISVTGSGSERTLHVTPAGVGVSKLTLTVEAPDGVFTSTQISYGASEYEGSPSDRYYSGLNGAGSAIEVGGGYMVLASDESNILNLYHERTSGPPIKSFDFNSELPNGEKEVNIHGAARVGNTIYWVGSLDNTNSGEVVPSHDTIFAATITGSGANTELTYLGSYDGLKQDLIEWDNSNGAPLGLAASSAPGQAGERANGFKVEGVEFLPGSSTEAYLTFRAPLEPDCTTEQETADTCTRNLALVIPVTNFSSLFTAGNPGTTHATFGTPLEWNLGGLSIRQIRKNAAGEYVIVASTANSSDTVFQLWGWDGEPEDEPVLLNAAIPEVAEGVWSPMPSVPEPYIANGDGVEVLQDDSKVIWYGPGTKDAEKGLTTGLQKDIGALIPVEIPAPGTPNPPYLSHGVTPNRGQFTLRWKPAPTLRARFTLQHQNALGGWSTIATGLSKREYTFAAGNPEEEGTWTYRVKESNETGESGYSEESQPIKVDKTPPFTPTATASRPPDYAGGGGWYKESVTVSFAANGDPLLADGSLGSGVNAETLTGPETFETSGSHEACGTVADNAGNVSAPGCLTVQVEATPPSLEVSCPATAIVGEAGVTATVVASDAYSGLASDPSGTFPIDTSQVGPQTITRTAVSNVGLDTTKSCTTQVIYPTPGAPALSVGSSPNDNGLFTLGWSGDDPLAYLDLSYTLQQHDAATHTWSTVASGIEALSYAFTGAGEEEGTWVFRVQGSDSVHAQTTEYSPVSAPVVVDRTPPYAPSAHASRPAEYAGDGGWYKNSVKVSFNSNGDPNLADGSPGSGVDPATLTGPETFETSGSHEACGTVADNAGNVSAPGCLTVQVEATPPSLEISCPTTAFVGEAGVTATVVASDAYSGLASDPSGTFSVHTSQAGAQTITRTAVSNVGLETTKSCTTQVIYPSPGAPALTVGTSPKDNGRLVLGWTGANPLQYFGLTYTLQEHNAATEAWTTVESGIEALSYAFVGAGEAEGTWVYRVEGVDPSRSLMTAYSPASAPVVIDETPPYAPSALASRPPDYAGGGGWYKDSVGVSFSSNGDPKLADGSPGSGVNPASIPGSQTFSASGSHTACGTVADNVGNVSPPGCLTVQVDATSPSLEISCPATAVEGRSAYATFAASDGYSGLANEASGAVRVDTDQAGLVTTSHTAISNVGLETTKSCTTEVGFTKVVSGTLTKKLVVQAGESVELTSSAAAPKGVAVESGGVLDVEGAVVSKITASKAALLRICAASISSSVKATDGSGPVVIGEGSANCAASTISKTLTLTANTGGVLVDGNVFGGSVKVTDNTGGATVTNNKVAGSLTVTGNSGTVVDRPNEVSGKSKLQ